MQPDYLRTILGPYKIDLLLEGKELGSDGCVRNAEPQLLTPDTWEKLRTAWAIQAKNLLVCDGSDRCYPQVVAGNERLTRAITKVYEGYMRAFAYERMAQQDYRDSSAAPEEERLRSEGRRINATYDVDLYTQYAMEYLQREGSASEKDAQTLMGGIIRNSIDTFCAVFPQSNPSVGSSSLTGPETHYPVPKEERREEPASLRHR